VKKTSPKQTARSFDRPWGPEEKKKKIKRESFNFKPHEGNQAGEKPGVDGEMHALVLKGKARSLLTTGGEAPGLPTALSRFVV